MILREPTKKGDKVKVTFLLSDEELEVFGSDGSDEETDVFVAGDFNSWNPGVTRLRPRGTVRSASLTLAAGRRYAFRYYRQGEWFNDQHADDFEPNGYGEKDCILDLTQ